MDNQLSFCIVDDNIEKKKTVIEFSDFFFNKIDDTQVTRLAEKIADYAELLTVVTDDRNVGMIGYYCNDTQRKIAYINAVVVKPNFRGMGIGIAMIKKVIADCSARGLKSIKLEVDKRNRGAIHIYTKLGFQKIDETSNNSFYYELTI